MPWFWRFAARGPRAELARTSPSMMDPLAASPFALLDARSNLRLVTDAVHEDDALCLALTCRPMRDALWARFPRRPAGGDPHLAGKRLRTQDCAMVVTVARVKWARAWVAAEDEMNTAFEALNAPRHCIREPELAELAARHGALATLQWVSVGFGRIVASEIEIPILLVNLV